MNIKILSGNELIVEGGLEAGFSLYTGYPGSPLADYFNILHERKKELHEKGIRVVIGNSEANAAAMASGAKQAGRDVCIGMKSMGLHVAADALSVGNFADPGPKTIDPNTGEVLSPGVVVVVGDDPWSISTSTPADSRYLFKHLHIPFLEPSTPQELKDWMKVALELSRRSSIYQGLLVTTFMAEGGGRVKVSPHAEVDQSLATVDPKLFDLSKNVMVPPNTLIADRDMINRRFPKIKEILKEMALDKVFGFTPSKVGFISSGLVFELLKHVLEEGDVLSHLSLYKTAGSFPLADDLLVPYLKNLETLIVVEEKRGFLETEISELVSRHNLKLKIYGKQFPDAEGFPAHGGLSFEIIRDKIAELFSSLNLGAFKLSHFDFKKWSEIFPRRLPTFCPGCPHRETLSLLKDLRKTLSSKDIDLISHGDVGCYSLSFLEPFKEMHNLSAMGQGGALGAGFDLFTTNPSVVLMGDSTFFHSGMTDISNSVQTGHNITYILLDNDNTAMTGHQMTPVSGKSVEGYKRPRQELLPIVKKLGVSYAVEVNPSDRYFYKNLLQEMISKKGVKVIVSNKECALTFGARKKSHDRKIFSKGNTLPIQNFYQINPDVCEDCRECVEMTGCPGLSKTEGAYGSKVNIDPQICVADSYCTKIKACPSFELVEVVNYHPSQFKKLKRADHSEDLPEPKRIKTFSQLALGEDLRIVVTGVGGSGVTTISRVLAEAAREMDGRADLDFKFVDQKGLAQRNGRVSAHLSIFHKGKSQSSITPLGTADLVLSPDLLDGSDCISFLSPNGLAILDTDFQMPLSIMLDRGVEKDPLDRFTLQEKIKEKLKDQVKFLDLKEICQEMLGRSIYATTMILGAAYQAGSLPFSHSNMKKAIADSVPASEFENNWMAFTLGRKAFLGKVEKIKQEDNFKELIFKSLKESALLSAGWLDRFKSDLASLSQIVPTIREENLMQYLHDQYIYNRGANTAKYLAEVKLLAEKYKDLDLLKIALATLSKCYFIKDEVFVSHQMLSPFQRDRDVALYGQLGETFKKTRINRPAFVIFGKKMEFDLSPSDWMLKVMRHLRFLRILMPSWHEKENRIGNLIRGEILEAIPQLPSLKQRIRLKELDNIKGYRQIRYEMAKAVLGDKF
jgi:indolepyruvate ferredoxin oxidoreductase